MLYVLHQVIDTEVNRILMQDFILLWLGIGLYLVLSMDMCQEAFNTRLPVCYFGSVRNPLALINS